MSPLVPSYCARLSSRTAHRLELAGCRRHHLGAGLDQAVAIGRINTTQSGAQDCGGSAVRVRRCHRKPIGQLR